MNSIALFTVFYPGAEKYVQEFVESVSYQTRKDFDLIIVNDGYKETNLQFIYPNLCIIELKGNNSISANRAIGINYVIERQYKYLFLCDVDDYMRPDRIANCIEAIGDNDIVVNNLNIVSADRTLICEDYFHHSIGQQVLLNKEFIKDKNIFGFSNTMLKVKHLQKIAFPLELKIVDWYYFTILLNKGLKAVYVSEALTDYRQYSGNMIGISSFTLDMFKKLLKLKIQHYDYMKGFFPEYIELYDSMVALSLRSDEELKQALKINTKNNPYPLWWQNVKS